MPKTVWKSPCFVEIVKTPEEKREEILLDFLEYLVKVFAAAGDRKAYETLVKLNKLGDKISNYATCGQKSNPRVPGADRNPGCKNQETDSSAGKPGGGAV